MEEMTLMLDAMPYPVNFAMGARIPQFAQGQARCANADRFRQSIHSSMNYNRTRPPISTESGA